MTQQYDNKNKGFISSITDQGNKVGSGSIDVNGKKYEAVLIKGKYRKEGQELPLWHIYLKKGVLAPEHGAWESAQGLWEKAGTMYRSTSTHEMAPAMSGPFDLIDGWRASAWRGENERGTYLQVKLGAPPPRDGSGGYDAGSGSAAPAPASKIDDDEIPW